LPPLKKGNEMKTRINNLMPNNVPRYVRCYDNNGESFDRFTVVFTKKTYKGHSQYVAMSSNPYHPQGFYQHGESDGFIDKPSYSHLGKKISFDKFPADCQKAVIEDYKAIWSI
jgi:hypothetical protein